MPYWPPHLPRTLNAPPITLVRALENSVERNPGRTALNFFGHEITYRELLREVRSMAAWLRTRAGVKPGDRVILYMQNSPQWVIAYHAALAASAVAVPVNPMSRESEFKRFAEDCGAAVTICSQELAETAVRAAPSGLKEIVVASYAEYLPVQPEFELPEWMLHQPAPPSGCTPWSDIISFHEPSAFAPPNPGDLAVLNYTSGSGGEPKGCRHTHETFLHSIAGLSLWHGHSSDSVFLGAAPFYQISGLVSTMSCAIFNGATLAPMPRWDRTLAAELIARYRITFAGLAPAAVRDLLSSPNFNLYDLSSIRRISSGGSPMPKALWEEIDSKLGLPFIEVYGMTEAGTIAINPIERPEPQCLGVPFFSTDVRIVDPDTLTPVAPGDPGEFLVRGPQLFQGYWKSTPDSESTFADLDGLRYFRTGDIGCADHEGYLFMTDRLKRMINASGYKVWPAEVESVLAHHPDILECCVIGASDPARGETVKALIVLRDPSSARLQPADVIEWARERMAAFKYPRIVEFVDTLPKSPAGKTLWRELQSRERVGD